MGIIFLIVPLPVAAVVVVAATPQETDRFKDAPAIKMQRLVFGTRFTDLSMLLLLECLLWCLHTNSQEKSWARARSRFVSGQLAQTAFILWWRRNGFGWNEGLVECEECKPSVLLGGDHKTVARTFGRSTHRLDVDARCFVAWLVETLLIASSSLGEWFSGAAMLCCVGQQLYTTLGLGGGG